VIVVIAIVATTTILAIRDEYVNRESIKIIGTIIESCKMIE